MMRTRQIFFALLCVAATILDCSAAHQLLLQRNHFSEVSQTQKDDQAKEAKQKQEGGATQESTVQSRPVDLIIFINDVRSAPAEFAADLLIRIAESNKVADPTWKRELIEEAFRVAMAAQQPVKRVALPSSPTDTRTGSLAYAFELKMDALSLQCRAVNAMLPVDKQKARELFGEIGDLDLRPLACEDALVYDVSDFYTTLSRIADSTFTQKETKNHEPLRLVESDVAKMSSPVEIPSVVDVITSIKTSRSQLESLTYTFSKQLGNVFGDDRAFTSSLYYVDRSIKHLVRRCLQQAISTRELLRAYRTYLIRHFSAPRCADHGLIFSRPAQSEVIKAFNDDLRFKSERNISEISPDDVRPQKTAGTVNAYSYWQSPKSSALLTRLKNLRFGSGNRPLATEERETLDWQTEMEEFLKDLADWRKEDEKSEEDYFHQKCVLLRSLVQLIPKETERERAVRAYIEFLNTFDLTRGSRIEWFWEANLLLKDTPSFDGPSGSPPSYVIRRSELMRLVRDTKNPILYLYAEAERLLDGAHPSRP
jgi:hypothetical protein